ncbi:bifunctional uridylate/adenylate kinase [Rhizoctonia solani]
MGLIEKAKDALHLNKDKTAGEAPLSPTTSSTPAFDSKKVMVIYVLGGPGAAGDLLREEQKREGSTYGALISEHIRNGTIVPMEVTVKLLENAIRANLEQPHPGSAWQNGHGRFLVDGFPRKMDQAIKFDETVCMSSFVLFFDTTEEVMLSRLLERGKTSGREDDNVESIKKRFRTFVETSMPVVDKYRAEGKVISIDSTRPIEVVHADVQKVLREELTKRGLPEK